MRPAGYNHDGDDDLDFARHLRICGANTGDSVSSVARRDLCVPRLYWRVLPDFIESVELKCLTLLHSLVVLGASSSSSQISCSPVDCFLVLMIIVAGSCFRVVMIIVAGSCCDLYRY